MNGAAIFEDHCLRCGLVFEGVFCLGRMRGMSRRLEYGATTCLQVVCFIGHDFFIGHDLRTSRGTGQFRRAGSLGRCWARIEEMPVELARCQRQITVGYILMAVEWPQETGTAALDGSRCGDNESANVAKAA